MPFPEDGVGEFCEDAGSGFATGATVSVGDPALGCGDGVLNNNVWFTVKAISNGTCTVTVSRIDNNPGLAIEVYAGTCGTLTTTGACNSANGPNGTGERGVA